MGPAQLKSFAWRLGERPNMQMLGTESMKEEGTEARTHEGTKGEITENRTRFPKKPTALPWVRLSNTRFDNPALSNRPGTFSSLRAFSPCLRAFPLLLSPHAPLLQIPSRPLRPRSRQGYLHQAPRRSRLARGMPAHPFRQCLRLRSPRQLRRHLHPIKRKLARRQRHDHPK
jgi:hypothetical protein